MNTVDSLKLELAILHAARRSMGVYPEAIITKGDSVKERTEWQNGWNAYGEAHLDRVSKLTRCVATMDHRMREMLCDGTAEVMFKDGEPILVFNTSDLFAWGYADAEDITQDNIGPLYEAWRAQGITGLLKWKCKQEGHRPQKPFEQQWREEGLWDDELERLPRLE